MGTNMLFINFGCIAIKKFLLRTAGSPLYSGNDMLPSVAFNYMILAIFVAVVLAVFEVLFSKNISFEVTEEKKNWMKTKNKQRTIYIYIMRHSLYPFINNWNFKHF